MKRILSAAATLALAAMVATPALATQTRINSLAGGQYQYTIRDSANTYVMPQFLANEAYKNSVDVDNVAGGGPYGIMNIRYALTDTAVLWLYGRQAGQDAVTTNQGLFGNSAASISGFGAPVGPPVEPSNHQYGLGFGTKLGETSRLGVALDISARRADGAKGQTEDSTYKVGILAGMGFDIGAANSIDFALNVGFGSFTDLKPFGAGSQEQYTPNGIFDFGLLFKGEFQMHDIAWLVPYVDLDYQGVGIAHTSSAPGAQDGGIFGDSSLFTIALGADLSIRPAEGITVQPGVGVMLMTSSVSGTNTGAQGSSVTFEGNQIAPYYGFAAEAAAFDWMVLRLGARQTVEMTNQNNTLSAPNTNEAHASTVVNTLNTGMGFALRGWTLDVNVNPQFFNNGVYAVTGTGGAYGLDFALGYKWL